MASLLGLSTKDLLGKTVEHALSLTNITSDNGFHKLLRGEKQEKAFQLTHPDGQSVWLGGMRHAYTDPISGQLNVVLLANDVSEIIRAEQVLDISNNSLKMVETLGGTGYWRVDPKTETLHWSDKVFEIHGMRPEDGPPALEGGINAYHPDDRKMVERLVGEAIAAKRGYEFVARLLRSDGTVVWVKALAKSIEGGSAKAPALVGSFRDITSEILNETRMLELETLLDHEDIGYFTYDILADLSHWSASTYRLLRINPNTTASFELMLSMIDEDDKETFAKLRGRTVETGEPFQESFRITTGDGRKQLIKMRMSSTQNQDGIVSNYFGSILLEQREN